MNLNLLHEKKSLKCISSVVASVKLITDTKPVKKGGLDNLSVPGFGTVTRCRKKKARWKVRSMVFTSHGFLHFPDAAECVCRMLKQSCPYLKHIYTNVTGSKHWTHPRWRHFLSTKPVEPTSTSSRRSWVIGVCWSKLSVTMWKVPPFDFS